MNSVTIFFKHVISDLFLEQLLTYLSSRLKNEDLLPSFLSIPSKIRFARAKSASLPYLYHLRTAISAWKIYTLAALMLIYRVRKIVEILYTYFTSCLL